MYINKNRCKKFRNIRECIFAKLHCSSFYLMKKKHKDLSFITRQSTFFLRFQDRKGSTSAIYIYCSYLRNKCNFHCIHRVVSCFFVFQKMSENSIGCSHADGKDFKGMHFLLYLRYILISIYTIIIIKNLSQCCVSLYL